MWRYYQTPGCAVYALNLELVNVLYVVFWVLAMVMNFEDQKLILSQFHKFPSFINIINSKGNGTVGGN